MTTTINRGTPSKSARHAQREHSGSAADPVKATALTELLDQIAATLGQAQSDLDALTGQMSDGDPNRTTGQLIAGSLQVLRSRVNVHAETVAATAGKRARALPPFPTPAPADGLPAV